MSVNPLLQGEVNERGMNINIDATIEKKLYNIFNF